MRADVQIVDGPAKYELFAGLGDYNRGRYVKLTVVYKGRRQEIEVRVDSIGIEDGSGESWMVTFSFHALPLFADTRHTRLTGYYSTKKRGGIAALAD